MKSIVLLLGAMLCWGVSVIGQNKPNESLSIQEHRLAKHYLEKSLLEWQLMFEQLDPEQESFKSDSATWSIKQNLQHIVAAESLVQSLIAKSLSNDQPMGASQVSDQSIIDQIAQRTEKSPKYQAPDPLRPGKQYHSTQSLLQRLESGRQITHQLLDSSALNHRAHTWRNPLFGEIDIYQWILFVGAHCERHFLQCQEIMQHQHFPQTQKNHYATKLDIAASPATVYSALSKEIDQWWIDTATEAVQKGDTLHLAYHGTHKEFVVEQSITNKQLVWKCIDVYIDVPELKEKTEWLGTKIIWNIEPGPQANSTLITFEHEGLQPQLECYELCQKTWAFFLHESLTAYLNHGTGKPLNN